MHPVADLFATGRIADCIIGLMLLEFAALTLIRARGASGIPPLELGASLAAGISLLLAMRAALAGSSWPQMAMWLIVSLMAHVLYLKIRWGAK